MGSTVVNIKFNIRVKIIMCFFSFRFEYRERLVLIFYSFSELLSLV